MVAPRAARKLAAAKYKPLQAAFWLKESEEGQWFLYLVSDQIDDTNFDQAYGEVHRLLGPPDRRARQVLYRRYLEQWVYDPPLSLRISFDCLAGQDPHVQTGSGAAA